MDNGMIDEISWHVLIGFVIGFGLGAIFLLGFGKKICGISMTVAVAIALIFDLSGVFDSLKSLSLPEMSRGVLLLWLSFATGIVALFGCALSAPVMRAYYRRRDRRRRR